MYYIRTEHEIYNINQICTDDLEIHTIITNLVLDFFKEIKEIPFIYEVSANGMEYKKVGVFTCKSINTCRKLSTIEFLKKLTYTDFVVSFLNKFPEFKYDFKNSISNVEEAISYIKAYGDISIFEKFTHSDDIIKLAFTFPEHRKILSEKIIFASCAYKWALCLPKSKNLVIDKIKDSLYAIKWYERFPEDKQKIKNYLPSYMVNYI